MADPRRKDSQEAAQHRAQSPIAPDGHTWPGLQAGSTEAGVGSGERGPYLPSSTHRAAQALLLGPSPHPTGASMRGLQGRRSPKPTGCRWPEQAWSHSGSPSDGAHLPPSLAGALPVPCPRVGSSDIVIPGAPDLPGAEMDMGFQA